MSVAYWYGGMAYVCCQPVIVQVLVVHNVTPQKCTYNEFDWRATSKKPHKKHKDLRLSIGMGIWWIQAAQGVGGLRHIVSKAATKGL